MTRPKHNFFKYSKAKNLVFEALHREFGFRGDHMTRFIEPFEIKWKKVENIAKYDGWLVNMFKSIDTLKLGVDATIFAYALPLDILFHPTDSRLQHII